MGLLLVKIKQMLDRLEMNNEAKSSLSKSLQTSTNDLDVLLHSKEKKTLGKVLSKLELIEKVVENQSNILGNQEAKLRALETTVQHAHDALQTMKDSQGEKDDHEEHDGTREKDKPLDEMFDEIFDDKSQQSVQSAQSSALLQEHAQTLQSHEERLNVAIERIQHIWDTLNTGSGSRLADIQKELKHLKNLVESLRKNHNALKTESHDELQLQHKLLDNLFSGFVVAFLLLVFICMFHK